MGDPIQDPRFKSDRVFNEINRQFITLKDEEMKEYNKHLKTVLDTFIEQMKRKDTLFNACYRRIAYVGSYYEGLKVGKPEEFDLNVIINLPIPYSSLEIIIAPEKPGYIKIKTSHDVLPNLRKHVRWQEYNGGSASTQLDVEIRDEHRYNNQRKIKPENNAGDSNSEQILNDDCSNESNNAVHRRCKKPRKKYYCNPRVNNSKNDEIELNPKNIKSNDDSSKKSNKAARQRRTLINNSKSDEIESNPKNIISDDNSPKKSNKAAQQRRTGINNSKNDEIELNPKNIKSNDNSSKKSNRAARQRRRRHRKKVMDSWFDKNDYLDQNKFRQWFESVVIRALSSFEHVNGKHQLIAPNVINYRVHHKKSGPAFTLKIDVPDGHTVDVDLVPALEFVTPPPKPFRSNAIGKQNWFAISKPLDGPSNNIMWRPSFYEKEGDLLKGTMKQVIRQMKKLRDTQNFKSVASYYIKTLCLRELEKQDHRPEFQRFSSTNLFFYMLQKFHEASEKGEIIDFWNPRNNLLGNISPAEMSNIRCRLNKIIKEVEKKISTDPFILAEFILTKEEYRQLRDMMQLSNAMASTSIQCGLEPVARPIPEPVAEAAGGGFFSGLWNAYWGTTAAPATQ